VREFQAVAERLGAERVVAVGTQVFRRANNSKEVLESIRNATGLNVEVLEEDTEAQWSFRSVSHGLRESGPLMVADIGGGSTELAVGTPAAMRRCISLPVGAVVLTETHLRTDPPEEAEVRALSDAVQAAMAAAVRDLSIGVETFFCVGGTATTLAALSLGLAVYDPKRVDGASLSSAQIAEWNQRLRRLSLEEKRALVLVDPDRADILFAGIAILGCILDAGAFDRVRVSDRGLRFGIALREFGDA
jgi:exopolyphosphatase/guanosine-5'-triphosphate,3'-diphosphate pyrophosphatase